MRAVQLERAADWAAGAARRNDLENLVQDILLRIPPKAHGRAEAIEAIEDQVTLQAELVPSARVFVVENLAHEVERQHRCVQASALEGGGLATDEHVVNEASGIWHAIAVGPPLAELSEWSSTCGWTFGRSRRSRIAASSEMPRDPKLLCQKCFASLRSELKEAHAEEMRRHIGV